MIYLLIAESGDYAEDHETWVVEVYTDEAAANEEAEQLNTARLARFAAWGDYVKRRDKLREVMVGDLLAEEWRSWQKSSVARILPEFRWAHLPSFLRNAIDNKIVAEMGPEPVGVYDVDDYTVVAVPIGERGRWGLP